ncbi:patatin [Shewanella mangrovi]|uniref:Patatin n=1 Tax=Shewanella mangrovi TaxID=1515746 RepID=A0A094JBJ5_9GAMM|nr:patatin-like phospholipase family protein [Shewanella mangrovi]KFZ37290.1 patatin [Shewanella mangrovi]
MQYPFKNLVFEGGGVKGIAYVGALTILEQRNIMPNIERIGGTSAGAINAVLLGLGYSLDETRRLLWSLDFNQFMDDSWGIVRDSQRLLDEFGWYKGDFFRQWIAELIAAKTGNGESTFADVHAMRATHGFKALYFVCTNLATSFSEVFSFEHTPTIAIADAVRISMSIPLFFAAKRNPQGDVMVDGGLLNNYPIKLFDRSCYVDAAKCRQTDYYQRLNRQQAASNAAANYIYNHETLGFRLDSKEEIAVVQDPSQAVHRQITHFFDYTWALIRTVLEAQQNAHLHSDDWARTVYIDTLGVNTTDFDISDELKQALLDSGRQGAEQFLAWYDNATPKPNKPDIVSR